MVKGGKLGSTPTPLDILNELKRVASFMIHDPLDRQWEIREVDERAIVIRRTQTYNCILQEGLLQSLVERTGVILVSASHIACTRRGAEFCDYKITWMPKL